MKANYKLVKTINGHRSGNVIDQFDNIEDAREELATQLMYAGNDDYDYFADEDSAMAEISFAEEARESWGDERVDTYIDALREGIDSGHPFIANSITGECISTQYDGFAYDNYTVEIETEEATCDPFEPGTSYPALTQDKQGNNKWVDYTDGSNLVGLSYYDDFSQMSDDFQTMILDNTEADDREAIEDGQVWADDDRTLFAILYND